MLGWNPSSVLMEWISFFLWREIFRCSLDQLKHTNSETIKVDTNEKNLLGFLRHSEAMIYLAAQLFHLSQIQIFHQATHAPENAQAVCAINEACMVLRFGLAFMPFF